MTASVLFRFTGFAVLLGLATGLRAEDKALQNAAYQASVEQEQIRTQTRRILADMNRMLQEFRDNPTAVEEVALTEATIQKLQSLSDKDMAEVVAALREASNPKNSATADKILAANKNAQEIRSALVKLADRLALFQDETSVDLRLTKLLRRQLANQRQLKYLQDGTVPAEEQERQSSLAATEQKAFNEEVGSLMQVLQRLTANKESSGSALFGAVYAAALSSELAPSAEAAGTAAAAKNFPATSEAQAKVVRALQNMLLALSSGKTQEERLRAAESQMRSLANREDLLARTTTGTSLEQQLTVARRQNEIADQQSILELEVIQLGSGAAPIFKQTSQSQDSLDSTLRKNRGLLADPGKKLEVVNTQKAVAGQFREIAEMLKKKADEVAGSSSGGGGDSDAATEAMSDAASSISEAIGNMDMAQNLLNQGGDAGAAQEQMGEAKGNLDEAMSKLGDAGSSAPPEAGKGLDQAKENLGKGGEQVSKGAGGVERSAANQNVGQAKEQARKVLSDLQKAISSASANQGQLLAGSQSNGPMQQGEGNGSGAGWGGLFHHKSESSTFAALAKISEKDPEAVSALQKERAPSEYDSMAQQYMKNLAEGSLPNP